MFCIGVMGRRSSQVIDPERLALPAFLVFRPIGMSLPREGSPFGVVAAVVLAIAFALYLLP